MSSILFMTKQASPLSPTLYYLKILRIVIIRRHEKILRIHYPDDNRDERLCNPARYHSTSCFHALICTPCLSPAFLHSKSAAHFHAYPYNGRTRPGLLSHPANRSICLSWYHLFSRKLQGQFTVLSLPSSTTDGSL